MIYAYLLVSCVVFVELFIFLDLKNEATAILSRSREAIGVVMSRELDDAAKESFMRRASVDMFKATLVFSLKLILVVVALYAIYWLVVGAFPPLRDRILQSFVSPLVIIALTLAALVYVWARDVVLKKL